MNDVPAVKIQMMKASIRCLVMGFLALVPFIGPAFGLAALWISGRIRSKEKLYWNPAQPYRIWGVVCTAVGTVLWTAILIIVIARLLLMAQGLD